VDAVINDLDLGGIGHTGNAINIRGQAASEQEVMEYVRKLTASGRFSEITISNLTRVGDTSDNASSLMNFSLTLQVKETPQ
jgi:outer membrane protein assembly factor BamA